MSLEQPQYLPTLRDVHRERVWPDGTWAKLEPEAGPLCHCDVPRLRVPDDVLEDFRRSGENSVLAREWDARADAFDAAHPGHRHLDRDPVAEAWSRPGIYVLVDREDRKPRYVGQTSNLRMRLDAWFGYTRRPCQLPLGPPVTHWLAAVRRSPLVWIPWLPTQGWAKARRPTWYVQSRCWDTAIEPGLRDQLLKAEARAIARLRAQGAPLLNVQLVEALLN